MPGIESGTFRLPLNCSPLVGDAVPWEPTFCISSDGASKLKMFWVSVVNHIGRMIDIEVFVDSIWLMLGVVEVKMSFY